MPMPPRSVRAPLRRVTVYRNPPPGQSGSDGGGIVLGARVGGRDAPGGTMSDGGSIESTYRNLTVVCRETSRRDDMAAHKVVKHDEGLKARKRHLTKEKEFTRMRDQLSRERRELPWELVEKQYTFQGEHGTQTLSDLFEGRGQLVVYHAMFNPDTAGPQTPWTAEAACYVCSFWMDNFNNVTVHLNHRDITMVAVSLAPYPKLAAYKKRMGWGFPWLSSLGSDFNFDYRVSFTDPGETIDYNYRLRPW